MPLFAGAAAKNPNKIVVIGMIMTRYTKMVSERKKHTMVMTPLYPLAKKMQRRRSDGYFTWKSWAKTTTNLLLQYNLMKVLYRHGLGQVLIKAFSVQNSGPNGQSKQPLSEKKSVKSNLDFRHFTPSLHLGLIVVGQNVSSNGAILCMSSAVMTNRWQE